MWGHNHINGHQLRNGVGRGLPHPDAIANAAAVPSADASADSLSDSEAYPSANAGSYSSANACAYS